MAVCERTYDFLLSGAYGDDFIGITPTQQLEPKKWCAPLGTLRPASETKGSAHNTVNAGGSCC